MVDLSKYKNKPFLVPQQRRVICEKNNVSFVRAEFDYEQNLKNCDVYVSLVKEHKSVFFYVKNSDPVLELQISKNYTTVILNPTFINYDDARKNIKIYRDVFFNHLMKYNDIDKNSARYFRIDNPSNINHIKNNATFLFTI